MLTGEEAVILLLPADPLSLWEYVSRWHVSPNAIVCNFDVFLLACVASKAPSTCRTRAHEFACVMNMDFYFFLWMKPRLYSRMTKATKEG